MMSLRILRRWSTPDIDALTISLSIYWVLLLPIVCSQRSRVSMYKGRLIHSSHCSEFVELTLKLCNSNFIHVNSTPKLKPVSPKDNLLLSYVECFVILCNILARKKNSLSNKRKRYSLSLRLFSYVLNKRIRDGKGYTNQKIIRFFSFPFVYNIFVPK